VDKNVRGNVHVSNSAHPTVSEFAGEHDEQAVGSYLQRVFFDGKDSEAGGPCRCMVLLA
jgi:hypothetical protein